MKNDRLSFLGLIGNFITTILYMNPVEKNLFLYNLCLGRNEVKAEIDLRAQGHDGTRSAGKVLIVSLIGLIHFVEMVFYVVFMIDIGRHDNFLVKAVLFPNALQV